jgi:hypothetical protein
MQYRRFGRTELQIPIFSCGGMRYQHKWQDIPQEEIPIESQINLEKIITTALDVGINHIETARFYGTSEMQLGKILPNLPREKLIIQTKNAPKENVKDFLVDFETSLNYLNLDYVDLFSIHGINNQELLDWTIRPGGCLEAAQKLQAQGKIKFIGFSTHAPTDLIIRTIESNQFDYVNLHYYWINQSNWPAIESANAFDMGVFIISPSDKGGKLYEPPSKLKNLCQPLSPIVFNDLFCLSHPQVHTLSIGAAKPEDFAEHLKAIPLLAQAKEHWQPISQRLEQEAFAVLGQDWLKTWHLGLPSWEDTPDHINIGLILWLRNLALAYDMKDYATMRYNLLGNANHWFPGNQATNIKNIDLSECLLDSPYKEAIPDLLLEADELLKGEKVKRLSQT